MIFLITFGTAVCSIVYELLLAQTLSTLLGDTVLRYNLTIGIFLAGLGIGALLHDRKFFQRGRSLRTQLLWVECVLAFWGGIAPLIMTLADPIPGLASILGHFCIFSVGFLSGFELPLLMKIAENQKRGGGNRVLAVDYLGTLVGGILFPLLLFPRLGIFSAAVFVGGMNAVVGGALLFSGPFEVKRDRWITLFLFVVLIFFAVLNFCDDLVLHKMSEWYLR